MKKFILLLCSLVVTVSFAASMRLEVRPNGDEQMVVYKADDWYFVSKESNYNVYLAKGEIEESNGYLLVQSLTEFDENVKYSYMEKPVKKIFSYGAMDCKNQKFYLLGDMFTAEDLTVQFVQYHEMGSHISSLDKEGTARNEVWKIVCNKTI